MKASIAGPWLAVFLAIGGCCREKASDGTCATPLGECLDGESECSPGVCIDLASDDDNCGACGATCSSAEVCSDGRCEPGACECTCTCTCEVMYGYMGRFHEGFSDPEATCTELEVDCRDVCTRPCGNEPTNVVGTCEDVPA